MYFALFFTKKCYFNQFYCSLLCNFMLRLKFQSMRKVILFYTKQNILLIITFQECIFHHEADFFMIYFICAYLTEARS